MTPTVRDLVLHVELRAQGAADALHRVSLNLAYLHVITRGRALHLEPAARPAGGAS